MTDWLPWGFTLMVGTFTTLALALAAVGRAPVGERPRLGPAWIALGATVVASFAIYSLYLLYGESWVWYLR
ncbi:MAG: hypothetical protein ACYDCK_04890 [Thermoplasmatota archaeon]